MPKTNIRPIRFPPQDAKLAEQKQKAYGISLSELVRFAIRRLPMPTKKPSLGIKD